MPLRISESRAKARYLATLKRYSGSGRRSFIEIARIIRRKAGALGFRMAAAVLGGMVGMRRMSDALDGLRATIRRASRSGTVVCFIQVCW